LKTASYDGRTWSDSGQGPGSRHAQYVDWLTIRNREQSVVDDVERIRSSPLVPRDIPIYGYVYSVETGRLVEVQQATAAGRVS
jgi:carbonic anhydrase